MTDLDSTLLHFTKSNYNRNSYYCALKKCLAILKSKNAKDIEDGNPPKTYICVQDGSSVHLALLYLFEQEEI